MRWDSTPFGKENPEPTGNGMGLYAFWRGESPAYRQWPGMGLFAFWQSECQANTFTARALAPGQEFRLCFYFVEIYVSSATYTVAVSSSSQVEENSGQLSNAQLAKSLQHKVTLMEEELRHDNTVIPNAPPLAPLTPATLPPPESPNQLPPPAVKCVIRRLGIGDQQSAESSQPPALECSSPVLHPSKDWLPMDNHYLTPPPAPRRD
jgi:hypothetical protein